MFRFNASSSCDTGGVRGRREGESRWVTETREKGVKTTAGSGHKTKPNQRFEIERRHCKMDQNVILATVNYTIDKEEEKRNYQDLYARV